MQRPYLYVIGILSVILMLAAGYGFYSQNAANESLRTDIAAANQYIAELERRLADAESDNRQLTDALTAERSKNEVFENQIEEITGTVGTLEKLATIDPELLAKYSKVYFLNENYQPAKLAPIDEEYRADPSRELEFHARALPHLEDLLEEAQEDGIELRVASAHRSFGTQAVLKANYVVSYGTGANRFSADQGYSEHQLGTTVDFTTEALGTSFTAFGTTEAYQWLLDNAHRFGFVLSYPEGNQYYMYEPWHWRYVGEELARDLRRADKHFYDLTQREIDEYLVTLFD